MIPAPTPVELPTPSPELVLLKVLLEAHLEGLPRRKALRFLKRCDDIMAYQDRVTSIRPRSQDPALSSARRLAAAWYTEWLRGLARRL